MLRKNIAVTAIVDHPALDAVRKGMIEQLATEGYAEGQNLTINYQSAQGSSATAGQIAKQFIADKPDAIVAISIPSAQPIVAGTSSIPMIFSAVTDPVTAKLVPKLDGSGTNVTGASNAIPLEPQLEFFKQVLPNVKNIGYIYSPAKVNSTVILKNLKAKAGEMGLNVIDATANSSTEIAMAGRSLAEKVDVIYTPTDNHVMSAYEALAKVATESKKPLFSMETSTTSRGAGVAIGVDYYEFGKETGKIVSQVLKG
ncbi:ABC transporter substrate-binding protein [Faucicola mancuniensis]|uniref:ABC transporter substrate-binding protein n=1 Tax=Faucicola mancuniensis TaxID=1309795 RepID=UPI0039777BD3